MIINQIRKGQAESSSIAIIRTAQPLATFRTLFDHVIQKFIFYALLRQLQPKKLKR